MNAITAASGAFQFLPAVDVRLVLWLALVRVAAQVIPVLASTLVLAWHGLRGTKPGPAAQQLLSLVEMLWTRHSRR